MLYRARSNYDAAGHFGKPVVSDPSSNPLPTLKALLFHVQKPLPRRCLADVGEHIPDSPPGSSAREGEPYYEVRLVAPPDTLNNLVKKGAELCLSRLGTVRVRLSGKIVAAESEDDCEVHCARKLVEEEVFYANAYFFSTGRRWSDPDQGEE